MQFFWLELHYVFGILQAYLYYICFKSLQDRTSIGLYRFHFLKKDFWVYSESIYRRIPLKLKLELSKE